MSIPLNDQESKQFREEICEHDIQKLKELLRRQQWGPKDSWRTKEAEAILKEKEDAIDNENRQRSFNQQSEANEHAQDANKIAKCAQWIAVIALIVSIIALFFKFN
jgi:hypothetical protein